MTTENPANEIPVLYAEDMNGSTVQLQLKRNRRYPERFSTMFHTTFTFLSGLDRPPCYYRTLMYCLAVMDTTHFRRISASEIAKNSGQGFSSVQRAMRMLIADKMLLTQGRASSMAYRINNQVGSNTSSEKWNQLEADEPPMDGRGRS